MMTAIVAGPAKGCVVLLALLALLAGSFIRYIKAELNEILAQPHGTS